jgi:manganese transport protein
MYRRILVALDHSSADESLLPHVADLAQLTGAELVLLHVATGWSTQWNEELKRVESQELLEDRAYLESVSEHLRAHGLRVRSLQGQGEPYREILRRAVSEKCDLIAMTTHGHRFLYDFLFGSTIDRVRHETDVPILVVRAGTRTRKRRGEARE